MRFKVNIDFKKGPSFGMEIIATSKEDAILIAKREAVGMGFDQAVKKASAVQLEA